MRLNTTLIIILFCGLEIFGQSSNSKDYPLKNFDFSNGQVCIVFHDSQFKNKSNSEEFFILDNQEYLKSIKDIFWCEGKNSDGRYSIFIQQNNLYSDYYCFNSKKLCDYKNLKKKLKKVNIKELEIANSEYAFILDSLNTRNLVYYSGCNPTKYEIIIKLDSIESYLISNDSIISIFTNIFPDFKTDRIIINRSSYHGNIVSSLYNNENEGKKVFYPSNSMIISTNINIYNANSLVEKLKIKNENLFISAFFRERMCIIGYFSSE